MIDTPFLWDAKLLHVDDIEWDDIAHVETPRYAHSVLKRSDQDIFHIFQSFQIQNRVQDQWRRGYLGQHLQMRDREREWLLDEVEQGRAYLRVKDPFAPVARWQTNASNPLGGEWQKLAHREFGFEPIGIFWLHQRIDALVRLRLLAQQRPPTLRVEETTAPPPRVQKIKEDTLESSPFSFS